MKTSTTFELARKAALNVVEAALAKQTALCYVSSKSCTGITAALNVVEAALAKQTALCYVSSKSCTGITAALNVVEAALRQSRNCTLRLVAKAAHEFNNWRFVHLGREYN